MASANPTGLSDSSASGKKRPKTTASPETADAGQAAADAVAAAADPAPKPAKRPARKSASPAKAEGATAADPAAAKPARRKPAPKPADAPAAKPRSPKVPRNAAAERAPAPRTGARQAPVAQADAMRAVAEGRHPDPASILGPQPALGGWRVTAFDPFAERMWLVTVGELIPMQPVPEAHGLFQGFMDEPAPYRLRGHADGRDWEFEDAYRFGPVLGEMDEYLIGEGTHHDLWHALGAHCIRHEGVEGVHFAVWAPNARRVSIIGGFNHWDARRHGMRQRGVTGVWELFIPGLTEGEPYKYEIIGIDGNVLPQKADPVGFGSEHPPATASVVRNLRGHVWRDGDWMARRGAHQAIDAPMSIYEVHAGSWKRVPEDGNRPLSYLELARDLIPYVQDMGFTHIELLPISEFPFDGSWGYQPIGLFAPTIRYGTPAEFRELVEAAHAAGIALILDWVPGHFPTDAHGLGQFDGTALYEHSDPREGFHQDWNTLIYNYGRREVGNYLIANAIYWLREYHVDGLRVDAVASMLYRDYSRKDGQWVPNRFGGRENLEAIDFLREMNRTVYGAVDGVLTAAEESTAFPGVSAPVDAGGLGFGYKWNMGWMNDTLDYIRLDPIHRRYHHNQLTFGMMYAHSENFILPISHDEVVHGKGSMIAKMPGDGWQKFANLRAYYGYMWTHPGRKLLFMGCEFAQGREWNHDGSLDWHLLDIAEHRGMQALVRDLNHLYRDTRALHVNDSRPEGFTWIEPDAAEDSILAYARHGTAGDASLVVICNFTPLPRNGWRVGMPQGGQWRLVLNSDDAIYGGSDYPSARQVTADGEAWQGQAQSALVDLPPLSVLIFAHVGGE